MDSRTHYGFLTSPSSQLEATCRALAFGVLATQTVVVVMMLLDKPLYLLILPALVGVAAVMMRPVYGLMMSMVLAYSGVASSTLQSIYLPMFLLTAFAWLLHLLHRRQMCLLRCEQNSLLVIFAVIVVFSALYASNWEHSTVSMWQFFKYAALYVLIINILDSWDSVRLLMWALVLTGGFMLAYGIHSFVSLSGMAENGGRLTTFIDDPNSFAIRLIPLVAFTFALFKTEQRWVLRLLAACIGIAMCITIGLTFSRGGYIALIVVLGLLVWSQVRKAWVVFAVVATVAAILAIPNNPIMERIETMATLRSDVSIVQRLKILAGGMQMFLDNPILGVGIGNFITHSQDYCRTIPTRVAHNAYLEVAAETGIIGLIPFSAILVLTSVRLRRCWRRLARAKLQNQFYPHAVWVGLAGFSVHALFLSEQFNVSLFMLIGLAVVINKLVEKQIAHGETQPET